MITDQTGTIITARSSEYRWLEHCKQLYNHHRDTTLFLELSVADIGEGDCPDLLRSDTEAAIAKLKKNKSVGVDNIST